MYAVLAKRRAIEPVVQPTAIDGLAVAPSHLDLSYAEVELMTALGREQILRERMEPVRGAYDYIILDCPPSLSVLTVNALTAADEVLIPVPAHFYAMVGFAKLLETIQLVQERLNRGLTIAGVVVTQFDNRTNYHREFVDQLRGRLSGTYRVFTTKITQGVKLLEAAHEQTPVVRYDPRSSIAIAYRELADEVLGNTLGKVLGKSLEHAVRG
jgi:chromosome partitioning protein